MLDVDMFSGCTPYGHGGSGCWNLRRCAREFFANWNGSGEGAPATYGGQRRGLGLWNDDASKNKHHLKAHIFQDMMVRSEIPATFGQVKSALGVKEEAAKAQQLLVFSPFLRGQVPRSGPGTRANGQDLLWPKRSAKSSGPN